MSRLSSSLILFSLVLVAFVCTSTTATPSVITSLLRTTRSLNAGHSTRAFVLTSNSTTVPQTYERFSGNFALSVSTSLPGGMSGPSIESSGTIAYDAPLRRVKLHFTGTTVGGVSMATDFTNLLDYSNNLNNTWGSGATCTCATVDDSFFYLYVTPNATLIGTETITIGTSSVTVQHYRDSFSAGFGSSGTTSVGAAFQSDFYVDQSTSTPSMAQLIITATVGVGDQAITTSMTYQFSSVTALPIKDADVKAIFTVDSSCPSCSSVTPATTSTYTAPAVCPDSCLCAGSYSADLTFCANIVNYPISTTTFAASTDSFVSSVNDATLLVFTAGNIDVTADCKTAYKEFLCHFYFLQCQSGGSLTYPTLPDFNAKCGASAGAVLSQSKEATPYAGNGKATTSTGSSGGASSSTGQSGAHTNAGISITLLVGLILAAIGLIKQ